MVENIVLISRQKQIPNDIYTTSDDLNLVYDYINTLNEVSVDTENSSLDCHTGYEYCFQIGDDKKQFIIDCLTFNYKDIKPLLSHNDKLYILQNAKYDLQWFYKHDIIITAKIWDTYLAELRLTNGIKNSKKNLQALEEKYLGTSYVDKSKRKDIHTIPKFGYTERVLKYSAGDIMVLPAIKQAQYKLAVEENQLRIIQLECEFVKVLAYSEYCGIYLDKNKWENIANTNLPKLKELENSLNSWIINESKLNSNLKKFIDGQLDLFNPSQELTVLINWNSSKQLIVLFELLGINCTIIEKGKTKKTVEAKLIEKQINKSTILPIYLEYSSVYKEVSTYGLDFLKFINSKTGRIHPSYFQVLASGRLSSGGDEQTKDSATANIMVIPREGGYRECFTAQNPDENILVNYDYSQMEDVVFANQSKVPALITLLKDGLDGHAYTAKIAFKDILQDFTLEEIKKKRPDLRQKAKAVKFAINFGGSDFTIANNLGISKEEGVEIYNNYFNGFPGLGDYFDLAEKNAIERGYILIDELTGSKYYIDGFERFKELHEKLDFDNKEYWDTYKIEKKKNSQYFKDVLKEEVSYYFRWKGAIRRHALNLPCQGTSSNITKIAAIYTFNEIIKRGWFKIVRFVLFLHDELELESPKELAEESGKVLYDSMIKAGQIYCKEVPLGASGGITEVWGH